MTDTTPTHESAPLPRPAPRQWATLLLGAAILLCGMAIGTGATLLWVRGRASYYGQNRHRIPKDLVNVMMRKLGLDEAQREKVEAIFARHMKALQAVRAKMEPDVKAEREKLRAALKDVLTPEQFKQWTEMFENARKRYGPKRHGRGDPDRNRDRDPREPGRGRGPRSRMAPADLFKRFDKDGDGRLVAEGLPESMRERFMKNDADGDGAVTPKELEDARRRHRAKPRDGE